MGHWSTVGWKCWVTLVRFERRRHQQIWGIGDLEQSEGRFPRGETAWFFFDEQIAGLSEDLSWKTWENRMKMQSKVQKFKCFIKYHQVYSLYSILCVWVLCKLYPFVLLAAPTCRDFAVAFVKPSNHHLCQWKELLEKMSTQVPIWQPEWMKSYDP